MTEQPATGEWYWTAAPAARITCFGSEDGRLFDYVLRDAYPVRPYAPGSIVVSPERCAAVRRVASVVDALAAKPSMIRSGILSQADIDAALGLGGIEA